MAPRACEAAGPEGRRRRGWRDRAGVRLEGVSAGGPVSSERDPDREPERERSDGGWLGDGEWDMTRLRPRLRRRDGGLDGCLVGRESPLVKGSACDCDAESPRADAAEGWEDAKAIRNGTD